MELVREMLPRNAWFAVNCHGGDGRCTTATVMLDMMHNAGRVNFDDILDRNMLLYDYDLRKVPKKEFKRQYAINRLQMLKLFFDYCRDTTPLSGDPPLKFSQWYRQVREAAMKG